MLLTKERPILFSGPMVRAILEGHKTMTRRVVTVPHGKGKREIPYAPYFDDVDGRLFFQDLYGDWHDFEDKWPGSYKVGDRLWVRETWRIADSDLCGCGDSCCTCGCNGQPIYAASIENDLDYYSPWRPSIHMPRSASRITLEVTGVRVERLQDISGKDAVAEGVRSRLPDNGIAQSEFQDLWDSINAKRPGCSWEANPWVWCIEFRRMTK